MTLEEADEIIEDELLSTDAELNIWNNMQENDKKKLIIKGTRIVDQLPFLGYKYNINNSETLHWPRVINNIFTECPRSIKLGLLKQVLRDNINKDKQEIKLQELGVKSYSIKGASISFSDLNYNKLANGIYNDIFEECFRKWTY